MYIYIFNTDTINLLLSSSDCRLVVDSPRYDVYCRASNSERQLQNSDSLLCMVMDSVTFIPDRKHV